MSYLIIFVPVLLKETAAAVAADACVTLYEAGIASSLRTVNHVLLNVLLGHKARMHQVK